MFDIILKEVENVVLCLCLGLVFKLIFYENKVF